MNHCQRCGRKLESSKKHCPYCGVLQERDSNEEKKDCKQCTEKIPVNANYCPYCGHDQAIFNYQKISTESSTQVETKFRQVSEDELTDVEKLIALIRDENEKLALKAAPKRAAFGKNETARPSLFSSTILMLKDTFTLDKRMGRADFWWGFLGMNLLFIVLMFVVSIIYDLWYSLDANMAQVIVSVMVYGLCLAVFFAIFTGLVRRFRDAEIPMIYLLLMITGIGEVICLLLALKPQQVTNFDYSFTSLRKKRQNDQNKPDR